MNHFISKNEYDDRFQQMKRIIVINFFSFSTIYFQSCPFMCFSIWPKGSNQEYQKAYQFDECRCFLTFKMIFWTVCKLKRFLTDVLKPHEFHLFPGLFIFHRKSFVVHSFVLGIHSIFWKWRILWFDFPL